MVQRPDARSARRGALRPRRGERRVLVAAARARRRPTPRTRCGTASATRRWRHAQPRTRRRRSSSSCRRTTRCGSRALRLTNDERARRAASRSSRISASSSARWPATAAASWSPSTTRAARMLLARNRVNGDFSDGEVFAAAVGERAARRRLDLRSRARSSAATAAPPRRAASPQAPALDGRAGAGLDPCFALQVTCEIPAGGSVECAFLFGEAADRAAARALVQRYRTPAAIDAALDAAREFWRDDADRRAGRDAGAGDRSDGQRLAALPGAELPPLGPLGALPVGRRLRLSRSAAGLRRARLRASRADARADPAARRAPVRRGRRAALVASAGRAAARARASPTICCGCRTSPLLRRRHRRLERVRRDRPASSPRRCSRRARTRPTCCRRRPAKPATSTTHCCRAIDRSLDARRARPAADGHRRLERRHEPRRPRGPRRERLARVLPLRRARRLRPAVRARAATPSARARYARIATALGAALERRRLGRRLVSARLLRRRHAARLGAEQRVPDRRARAGVGGDLGRRAARARGAGDGGGRRAARRSRRRADPPAVRRPSTATRTIPATSRATCPASARTAASTRTARLWALRALRRARAARPRRRAPRDAEPGVATRARAERLARLPGRAVRRRRRRLRRRAARRPRRLDLVHGLGRLDVPRRARVGPRRAHRRRRRRWWSTRASRTSGPASASACACRATAPQYEIAVENPDGRSAQVVSVTADGKREPSSPGWRGWRWSRTADGTTSGSSSASLRHEPRTVGAAEACPQ